MEIQAIKNGQVVEERISVSLDEAKEIIFDGIARASSVYLSPLIARQKRYSKYIDNAMQFETPLPQEASGLPICLYLVSL